MTTILRDANGRYVMEMSADAGLAPLLVRTKGITFGILTAFRHNHSQAENRERNSLLRYLLYEAGLHGFYQLIGHFKEDGSTLVTEYSFLTVKPPTMDENAFINTLSALGNKFEQDSVLIGVPTERGHDVYLYEGSGDRVRIGTNWSAGKAGEYYSAMRSQPNTPFVFEGHRVPGGGLLSVYAMRKLGYAW